MKIFSSLKTTDRGNFRRFFQLDDVINSLRALYPDEKNQNFKALLIFDTQNQHTWLIVSDRYLHCVIDNRKHPRPKELWRVEKSRLAQGPDGLDVVAEDFDQSTGLIIVADQKVRKFSRSLFNAAELKRELRHLLQA